MKNTLKSFFGILACLFLAQQANAQQPELPEDPGTLKEKEALEYVVITLKVSDAAMTPENLRKSMEITENLGGLDNEFIINPWLEFCKKHKNKVYTALNGLKDPRKDAMRLYLITSYCIDNGLQLDNPADQKMFVQKNKELQFLVEAGEN